MKKRIPEFMSYGLGMGAGTVLYTGFLSSAHKVDWGRAIFVAVFCSVIAYFWPRKKD
jgi:hypothetical protein